MTEINIDEAKKIACEYLLSQDCEYELALLEDKTLAKEFGWVFFYNTKKYLETKDFRDMLGGNAPIIIDKNTGKVTETGTANPIEDYIDEYEKSRKVV